MRRLMPQLGLGIALWLGSLGMARPANADPAIELLPRRVVFGVGQNDAELVMINRSARPVTFSIELERLRMDALGRWSAVTAATDGEQFADKIVRLAPRRAQVAPGGAQVIRLQRFKTPAGDEARAHVSMHITSPGGVAVVKIPLIVKVRPNAEAKVRSVRWVSPSAVEVVIERQGSTSVYGAVVLDWLRPDGGHEPADRRDIAVYPPLQERIVTLAVLPRGEGWRLRARYLYADSVSRQ